MLESFIDKLRKIRSWAGKNGVDMEPIAVEKIYPGTCVIVVAHLDTIVQQISVDIGFRYVVTPYSLSLNYSLLLPDVPAVELYTYSLET